MSRVAFVTTTHLASIHEDVDRPLHERAFAARGIELVHAPWDEPEVAWDAFDLVVIRSPWDYADRPDAFLAWLDSVAGLRVLHNPAALVRWNLDKHYLLDLADRGVPIVPTAFAATAADVDLALARRTEPEIVVKPAVSAGSRLTGRFDRDDERARELAQRILDVGKTVMVSPCVPSVAEVGERSLVAFDGVVSHALVKGPILAPGGELRGGAYQEQVRATEASPDERRITEHAFAAIDELAQGRGWVPPGSPLLYGRLDLVAMPDGTAAVLEAELFEPSFFLGVAPGSADRFAEAVSRRLGR